MKEIQTVVPQKHQFESRNRSKLIVIFGFPEQPKYYCKNLIEDFWLQSSSTSGAFSIKFFTEEKKPLDSAKIRVQKARLFRTSKKVIVFWTMHVPTHESTKTIHQHKDPLRL